MNQEDLKLYNVIVGAGSGCLFQPLTNENTYILTAKHLLFKEVTNDKGQKIKIEKPDGEVIEIKRIVKTDQIWIEELVDFHILKGVNYFPHVNADCAILKIEFIPNFDNIFIKQDFNQESGFELHGYPAYFRLNMV